MQDNINQLKQITKHPAKIWLLIILSIIAIALITIATITINKYLWADKTLKDTNPKIARLEGLIQNQAALENQAKELEQNINQHTWSAQIDAGEIANNVLQTVRAAATQSNLTVSSSQTLLANEQEQSPFTRISLDLRLEGDWENYNKFWANLAAKSPTIYIQTIQLNAQNYINPNKINAQIILFTLRQKP